MRAIPEDNLAYPILIEVGDASVGSGFLLSTGSSQYLISAKHVFLDNDGELRSDTVVCYGQPRDLTEKGAEKRQLDLRKLQKAGNIRANSPKDVIAIKMGSLEPVETAFRLISEDGVETSGVLKSGVVQVLKSSTKLIKDVLIGNDAVIFGYPVSIGLRDSPQIDYSKPLLRKGIIAGKYEEKGTLIIDCFVYPGNSGGPVIEIDIEKDGFRYSVIGLVSQFVPATEVWKNTMYGYENTTVSNSGYTVVVGMDSIFDLTAE